MFNSNKKRKLLFVFIVSFITILSLVYKKDTKFNYSVLATHTCTSSSYSGVQWSCTDCENCGVNPGECNSGRCGLCETCSGGSCVKATAWTDCGGNCASYGSTDCNTSGDSSGISSWGSACTGSGPVKCWCNSSGSCIGHHDPVCTLSSSQITLKSGYDWSSTTGAKHTISCSPCSNGETSYYTSASSSDCTTCSNGAACGTSTCTCSGTGPLRSCQSQCASCSNGAACGTSTCTCSGSGLSKTCNLVACPAEVNCTGHEGQNVANGTCGTKYCTPPVTDSTWYFCKNGSCSATSSQYLTQGDCQTGLANCTNSTWSCYGSTGTCYSSLASCNSVCSPPCACTSGSLSCNSGETATAVGNDRCGRTCYSCTIPTTPGCPTCPGGCITNNSCPTVVNGVCNNSVSFGCTRGSAFSIVTGVHTNTWFCSGSP